MRTQTARVAAAVVSACAGSTQQIFAYLLGLSPSASRWCPVLSAYWRYPNRVVETLHPWNVDRSPAFGAQLTSRPRAGHSLSCNPFRRRGGKGTHPGKHRVTIGSHSLVRPSRLCGLPITESMHSGLAACVTVAALATQREALSDSLTCREVDEWFRQDNERRSVVLERPDGSAKLVNRSAFYQTLLGPMGFGWALYAKEPAALLPTPAGLSVEGHMLAVDAAMQIMAEQISSNDDLLVVGGPVPTTISTSTLLAQLARAQTEQAGRLEALLQNVSEAILVVDEGGIIRYTARPAARWLGIRRPTTWAEAVSTTSTSTIA